MHEGGDEGDEVSCDLAESAWVVGADYVKGWIEARDAAEEVRAELLRLGCAPDEFRVAIGTGDGGGMVRFYATPAVIRCVALALRQVDLSSVQPPSVGRCSGRNRGK